MAEKEACFCEIPCGTSQPAMNFEEKRTKTLATFQKISELLKKIADISQFKMVFGETTYPFWNQINGPIPDALWHTG